MCIIALSTNEYIAMFTTVEQNIKFAECYIAKKKDATRRKLEFTLSLQAFINMKLQTHCAYTGLPFSDTIEEEKMTMERIDNDKGYINGNVVPVMKKYNSLRNNLTSETIDNEIQYRIDKITSIEHALMELERTIYDTNIRLNSLDESKHVCKKEQVLIKKYVIPAHKCDKYRRAINNLVAAQLKLGERQALIDKNMMKILHPKTSKAEKQHLTKANVRIERKLKSQEVIINAQRTFLAKFVKGLRVTTSAAYEDVAMSEAETLTKQLDAYKEKSDKLYADIQRQREIIEDLKLIALIRFENLSATDCEKIAYGLPLSTSIVKLLKHKTGYNLLNNHI